MFASGGWEHALVIFHRVKRQTNGANKNADRGIQRCLEAINKSLDQIQQLQVFVLLTSCFSQGTLMYWIVFFSLQRFHILKKMIKRKSTSEKTKENQM